MATTYTPGPWKAVNAGIHWNNPDLINLQIQYGNDGECIADTVYEEADANLIAAAPDLIEALKTTLGNIQSLKICYPCTTFDPWIETVSTAIAKAEGRP